jgi:hypothetical protein
MDNMYASQIDATSKNLRVRIETMWVCHCFAHTETPMYVLDISGDGLVTFDGLEGNYTLAAGKQRAKISAATVRFLARGVLSSPDTKSSNVYRPFVIRGEVTVSDGNRTVVRHFDYDRSPAATVGKRHPLIDAIERLVDIERWISENDATNPTR